MSLTWGVSLAARSNACFGISLVSVLGLLVLVPKVYLHHSCRIFVSAVSHGFVAILQLLPFLQLVEKGALAAMLSLT